MLVMIIGALTVMLILVAGYAPDVMRAVQREKEEEMLFRGQQIVNAIWQFRAKVGREPTSLQQLSDGVLIAGNRRIRFLRSSALRDPMTGDGRWRIVRYYDPVIQRFFDAYLKSVNQAPSPMLARYTGILPKGFGTLQMAGGEGTISSMGGPLKGRLGTGVVAGSTREAGGKIIANLPGQMQPAQTDVGDATTPQASAQPLAPITSITSPEATDEGGNLLRPMLGVVSRSKKNSVRVFYDDLDNYNDWPFIYIPDLAQQPVTNQDARLAILMSPIIFPSDPLALLLQQVQGRGQIRGMPTQRIQAPVVNKSGAGMRNQPPPPPFPPMVRQ